MICMLALLSPVGVTPINAARAAVYAGDADGDSWLNAKEFQAQLLESKSFRTATFSALDWVRAPRPQTATCAIVFSRK